ncbi:hypothetical protein B0I35DRAFT_363109 [Stachybotrys elegans]|uniref:DUF6594 domain-containing protein n=1 Tax=Stachybotrys elegans TaxID=80388 RepID=A0A8K0WLJ5_9HYPO|nr:hypothetical protein B0I35DRAFT_363109 [Stachybotrys elegans]
MTTDLKPTAAGNSMAELFLKIWPCVTDDNNLTLHGFRRFKVTHLVNLRLLEQEIARIDRKIYQAGLCLGHEPSPQDRLGLRDATRDSEVSALEDTITPELALVAFGNIMAMETVSLLDDGVHSSLQEGLSLFEKYNARLVRVDLGPRSRTDPFQRWLHRRLRAFRYWRIANRPDDLESNTTPTHYWSRQNTVLITNIAGRMIAATIASFFLVVPLVMLSARSIRAGQVAVVCVSVALFAIVLTAMLRVSSYEMMAASAAYAAVLTVFLSSS